MSASKIGSANTYTKCLKELDAWGYLKYNPSYNPHLGSIVHMYTFDKGNDNGSGHGTDKTPVIAVIPYINSINNTNNINQRKRANSNSLATITTYEKSKKKIPTPTKTTIPKKRKKVAAKKESHPERSRGARRSRPLLLEVQTFFLENNWPQTEAEKYYNHYQSNGWLVAGKTPMADWKASATKWMLNYSEFKKSTSSSGQTEKLKPDNLNTTINKNYNEPL